MLFCTENSNSNFSPVLALQMFLILFAKITPCRICKIYCQKCQVVTSAFAWRPPWTTFSRSHPRFRLRRAPKNTTRPRKSAAARPEQWTITDTSWTTQTHWITTMAAWKTAAITATRTAMDRTRRPRWMAATAASRRRRHSITNSTRTATSTRCYWTTRSSWRSFHATNWSLWRSWGVGCSESCTCARQKDSRKRSRLRNPRIS